MRGGWFMAAIVSLVVILVCTLFPFHLSACESCVRSSWDVLLIPIGPDGAPDILDNVLLFVPLGFTMAGYFNHRRITTVAAVTGVLLPSLCVSYSIEVLQLFMPSRFGSLTDVLSNTTGAGVGMLCHSVWHRYQ